MTPDDKRAGIIREYREIMAALGCELATDDEEVITSLMLIGLCVVQGHKRRLETARAHRAVDRLINDLIVPRPSPQKAAQN